MNMKKENKNMLLRFVVKNYKSFRDEAVLDLTASSIKDNEGTLLEENGVKVLPVIGIYGANASGKSNLIKAFKVFCNSVNGRWTENEAKAEPYIFSEEWRNRPSEFEASISIGDKEYRYGFEKQKGKYLSEWLFVKNFKKNTKSQEKLVFFRQGKTLETDINNQKDRAELTFIVSMSTEEELILTLLGKRGKSKYDSVFNWFVIFNEILDYSDDKTERIGLSVTPRFLISNPDVKDHLIRVINEIDPCIIDLIPEKEDDSDNYVLYTKHLTDNGKEYRMKVENESSGTKKLISLLIDVFLSIYNDFPLFIDEFDAKLHPLIVRKLINMYNMQSRHTHKTYGQLVFTAHNLICMDSRDLRRDEVWFVEKNNQASELYSLYDFNTDSDAVRADLSFGKNYLAGRFGAVPFQERVNG